MLIPALDILDGQVVRLFKGDYGQVTRYGDDPGARFAAYAQAGARYLHLVDLSGARNAAERQWAALREVIGQSPLPLQVGGGVRCFEDVQQLLALGAERVVVGSLAIKHPALVAGWLDALGPEKLVLALDVRFDGHDWYPASHGWQEKAEQNLDSLLAYFMDAGARHFLITDIDRDGTLGGANAELYANLTRRYPGMALQASGGVASLAELPALKAAGVKGVILGKSLLDGKFTLEEALSCWQNA
ncbi:1-(5-phosphoribosyl)-5-[(5-phosphoribosylamino)methylideneamino] imidazole-4-carboxamide isomerase [Gallaecimonas kandeliae]|uniref:1-(5-phosphoribosyl)-5-[(5- phosphoribosylamino)methylideneamino]imidazole-4- carboxamide isomerase n=1 Tax=Gallaecimonas kandeliae TaxID=3029055 RepID=UPI0026482A72|nr:1-(5-phosphoribosyl)-5-[(5-phosphoribosylamino)methylideneamino] imidazole-4-carboxamide isomerase [Gallaecimonas kandeliae]WKE64421.1 1-(5-phosphoribosyl)-5-[(5-phosphoribosylamino)methylideneamino] imidazole-4-carboxamide isomerase [Gallaecimonas kandeliae]